MAMQETARSRPEPQAVAEALEPEAGLLASADPLGFAEAVQDAAIALMRNPLAALTVWGRLNGQIAPVAQAATLRALGGKTEPVVEPDPRDRRFDDRAWERDPWYFWLQQSYLLWVRLMYDLVDAAELDGPRAVKADFAVRAIVDALAPTNFLLGNPKAMRRAVETGGGSLLAGVQNMLMDVATNGGRPRQVDTTPFRVGENLAATPGKVVYRNELMELLQYAPQTETTYEVPLLLSPPWINKYYIMDLAPGRSFVEWAVQQGHTVFAISYRNPDDSMRHAALDDYLLHGPHTALEVIADITGQSQANIVGLCLGGTLTAMLLAYLADTGQDRIRSATLLNTLIDFSEPGALGSFTDPRSVRRLARRMTERGYLDGREMSLTFDMLRPNDLIWNYVVSNWLMGEQPPAFDILAWNADSTRMPAAMHSFYLRHCYGENQLARGEMTLAGTRLHLHDIPAEIYLLAAKEDHIVPWRSSYKATQLFRTPVRFVLTSSGHVAGIVNPPGPKAKYWTNDATPTDPEAWMERATARSGSWWEDWARWIGERAGERREPPPIGSDRHPPIADAPGSYVHER